MSDKQLTLFRPRPARDNSKRIGVIKTMHVNKNEEQFPECMLKSDAY